MRKLYLKKPKIFKFLLALKSENPQNTLIKRQGNIVDNEIKTLLIESNIELPKP